MNGSYQTQVNTLIAKINAEDDMMYSFGFALEGAEFTAAVFLDGYRIEGPDGEAVCATALSLEDACELLLPKLQQFANS